MIASELDWSHRARLVEGARRKASSPIANAAQTTHELLLLRWSRQLLLERLSLPEMDFSYFLDDNKNVNILSII